jgi:flagellar hook protein FlgE
VRVLDIALQGMQRNLAGFTVAAQNLANVNTDGYRALRYDAGRDVAVPSVDRGEPPPAERGGARAPSNVDIAAEAVDAMRYEHGFRANARVVAAANRVQGELLDILG